MRVKFLDLSVPQDRTLPDSFAKTFHPDFKGLFLDDNILRVYTKTFNVYFARSLIDETQMDHTTHLYLIKRDKEGKQLRYIYTAFPYDFAQIKSDIQGLIDE
jgi:protein SCO1/2